MDASPRSRVPDTAAMRAANELSAYELEELRNDGAFILYIGRAREGADATPSSIFTPSVLAITPASEQPAPGMLARMEQAYALRDELDRAWAVRPLALVQHHGRTMLVLDDPGGQPLDRTAHLPMALAPFLRVAISIAGALRQLHDRGLIHKDIKPANVIAHLPTGRGWLTGFDIASRLSRERQAPDPPEFIAGTLAYMAPEQTGRMNRSLDSRADLYSFGVTLYELVTGSLPFSAADPMEWVHCHVARQPVPPVERVPALPAQVSAIILKLLAKAAEDRYQTAAGLEVDLRRCLSDLESRGRIDPFLLGTHDRSGRLLMPEKLYGRDRQRGALLEAFEQVVATGRSTLVLVSGYSGIGKSSVVNELHRAIVRPRGLFLSGKFDQYKRDIPYATIAQAFQTLIRQILGTSDAEIERWRGAIRDAVGPNGQLIVNLIPELELVIGPQPAVPELPPSDAESRFHLVFRSFLGVFAQPDHPLALFLDDLQWLDAATLKLLEDLATHPDVRFLLLIGAFRDNEVDAGHPLIRTLDAIRRTRATAHPAAPASGQLHQHQQAPVHVPVPAPVRDIVLAPLSLADVIELVADTLRCSRASGAPLASLVHDKTLGNPFFAIQFLTALAEERLLEFDARHAIWTWDLERIKARGFTDNVVDLMVDKLERLPTVTQETLKQLACLGNHADVAILSLVHGSSVEQLHADLWDALRLELIARTDGSYRFAHDRVQEAAYSLLPAEARGAAHLRIGRLLASRLTNGDQDEQIFEIVNQLNRGAHLIETADERVQVAALNLRAGRRAQMSTAYDSALAYLTAGRDLLTDAAWDEHYDLIFALEYHLASCELLTAHLAPAEARLSQLARRARLVPHIAAVTRLRLTLYTTLDRSDRGVDVCLEYLDRRGARWSAHPSDDEVRREYERIWTQLGTRSIDALIDLPLMTDPDALADLDVLAEVVTPALFTDQNLVSLVICRMVNLSLERGNSDSSCFGYVWFAIIAGPYFGHYKAGFQFGQLGYELVDTRGLTRFQARTYMSFGNIVMPWTRHVRTGRDLVRRAFDAANTIGDLTFAAYSCNNLNTNLLAAGDPLPDVQREAERGLAFAQKTRFGLVIDIITAQLALIRTLRGLTPTFGRFDDDDFDEARFEAHLSSDPVLALPECWYWIRKLQARYFAGDFVEGAEAAWRAQRLLWTSPSLFETAEQHFYGALCHAACCDGASPEQRVRHREALAIHHRQLAIWAENCPENFETRVALVRAEMARLDNHPLAAEELYERAIRSAHAHGFVHNEALANELAARFYAARGFAKIAHAYARDARYGYLRWGAVAKVRQLDQQFPRLRDDEPAPGPTSTIGAPVEHLDLATIVKVSQAVSGEIVLEQLIATLMRVAIEHAGAERGVLILPRSGDRRIEAEATIRDQAVSVHVREGSTAPAAMPQSVLQYVMRTHDSVMLDDAAAQQEFAGDPYIVEQQARSVLCLPLLKQASLIGVLYLENNLTSHVFTPGRIAVLKLLASQAAISLENTRLYRDLEEREARIRRLVDANIMGVFIWHIDGRILDANEAFLRMLGFAREDLRAGRLRWDDLTPVEWHEANRRAVTALRALGMAQPFEKEYFRSDGSRVPVLNGGVTFESTPDEGLAFVIDLTERKRTEAQLQEVAGRLITAQEEERRRIGRELHDHISQQLALLAITIDELIERSAEAEAGTGTDAVPLRDIRRQTADIISEVHGLSHRLHSTVIDHMGLVSAVERLLTEWSSRQRVRIAFTPDPLPVPVSSAIALCLFRVVEESLANIAKHSGAESARVAIGLDSGGIGLSIEDDGRGFRVEALDAHAGLGFISMRERLRLVGGTMRVRSAPSQGTRVDAWVPIASDWSTSDPSSADLPPASL